MQKKAIAVAVAGALAAPAVAMAQSTVQIYGNFYIEHSFVSTGRNAAGTVDPANADVMQAGGSAIGFKGQEKLGGGMTAWFQCESTADPRGASGSSNGFCTRDSAVGLKGGFGNVFLGTWGTPFKRARIGNVGGRDTGVFGTAFLLYGNSTTVEAGVNTGVFSRRQRNSINYDSPMFGGFQFMASMTSTNSSTATTTTSAGAKPRVWSLAGVYKQGKLAVAAAYQKHSKLVGANGAPGAFSGDQEGYHVSGNYTFGNVKVGGVFTHQESEAAAGVTAEVDAYHLGAEWKLGGPHNLHFGYTVADDIDGPVGAALGVSSRPASTGTGDTGAKIWQIRYVHQLSKRTTASLGYVNLKNDTSATYDLGGVSGTGAGAKNRAIAYSIQHKF
jgi:predicted porin